MSRIKPKNSGSIELKPGKKVVIADELVSLSVSPGHAVKIYEKANQNSKQAAPPFYEGRYPGVKHYNPPGARAMHGSGYHKLVVCESTELKSDHFIKLEWDNSGKRVSKLPPGEWTSARDKDFINDRVKRVWIPKDSSVMIYKDAGFHGDWIELTDPGWHDLDIYDLKNSASSIKFKLDEWKEVNRKPGKEISRTKVGEPILRTWSVFGVFGDETDELVEAGFEVSKEEHWDVSATVGLSQEVSYGAPFGAEAKTTVSFETTASGGENKGRSESNSASTVVHARILEGDTYRSGSVIFQRLDIKTEVLITLMNKRNNKEITQKKVETFHTFDSKTVFDKNED